MHPGGLQVVLRSIAEVALVVGDTRVLAVDGTVVGVDEVGEARLRNGLFVVVSGGLAEEHAAISRVSFATIVSRKS